MQIQSSKTSGNQNRVSGFLRFFVFSLLTVAFAFTSLHAQTVAYVTNFNNNTVSAIDTSTNTVRATIPVGPGPNGVVVSPDSTRVYVANFSDASISVIGTGNNTVVQTFPLPNSLPDFLAITPDGKTLYVPTGSGSVLVVDAITGSVIASIPTDPALAAAITPDGSRVYVVTIASTVDVIDTATNTLVGSPIPFSQSFTGLVNPAITMTPDGTNAYLAGEGSDNVSVLATSTNTIGTVIPFPAGSQPFASAVNPAGNRAYVALLNTATVAALDTSTNTQTAVIGVGNVPSALAVTPDGSSVYVTNAADNTVSVINTATNTVTATIPVGVTPVGIAFATLGPVIFACPTVITQPGTFRLVTDLHCFNTDGIDIRSNNVVIKLGGHSIIQDAAHFGFVQLGVSVGRGVVGGATNVQIFGPGTITGFGVGVAFEQVINSMVKNVTATQDLFGFTVAGGDAVGCGAHCPSGNNVFSGNTATQTLQGFTLNNAFFNHLRANNASNNRFGFVLGTGQLNMLQSNTANNNSVFGIDDLAPDGIFNTFQKNTAQGNGVFDLNDNNPNCDSNKWQQNTFGKANQPCIH